MATIKVQTNRVWIGDPCYVIHQELRDDVCGQLGNNGDPYVIKLKINEVDHEFIMVPTLHGDGVYIGSSEFKYGVDSGCLGIVPDALIDRTLSHLGVFLDVEVGKPIDVFRDEKGDISFIQGAGLLEQINTGLDVWGGD